MNSATVGELLGAAATRLGAAGVASPRLDAALLLAHVLGVERHRLAVESLLAVPADRAARFEELVAQRARRRPVSHLVGEVEFWSLRFRVTDATLAPRPETELLVERAVALLQHVATPVVAEVGTGTGCIAVAIAREMPRARVHAVDISAAALDVARGNARRHGVAERIVFHEGDVLGPLDGNVDRGALDLVVSNPPYVRRDERDDVDPEVLWEPAGAVFCDGDPADVYARIAREGAPCVRCGGSLLLELPGSSPERFVAAVAAGGAWTSPRILTDLAGLPRVLAATRSAMG